MNPNLRSEIVKHIFANFGVIPADYVSEKTRSLIGKDYLLPEKLSFENEDSTIENKIWGCQLSSDIQEIKILLADCTQEENSPEYCLLVQLKNAPAYGVYLVFNESFGSQINSACMIAYSVDFTSWMECSTFLQATFLGGMEQVRETGFTWNKVTNYQPQYKSLVSFIKYHSSIYEAEHEGQEG
jgi:hypothetical protein